MILISKEIRTFSPKSKTWNTGPPPQGQEPLHYSNSFPEGYTDPLFFIIIPSAFSLVISPSKHLRSSPGEGHEKVSETLLGLVKHSERVWSQTFKESLTRDVFALPRFKF